MKHTIKRRDLLAQATGLGLVGRSDASAAPAGVPVGGGVPNIAVAPEPTLLTSAFLTTMDIGMVSSKILEGLVS